jgi:hypothetical protein
LIYFTLWFLDVFFGKSTVTDEQIERKSRSILGEYFTNEKIEVNINIFGLFEGRLKMWVT